ncbi:MAG: hypothetical protein EOM36_03445 [Bacteroidia bacterium]|nr:hypothetical protein [Bacteroidia bacterium]
MTIQKDRWYNVAESSNFPVSGEISVSLGSSSVLFHASVSFSNALISLINYSIIPGISIHLRIQKTNNKHLLDLKFTSSRAESEYEIDVQIITGSSWVFQSILESHEYLSICQLTNIKDIGGASNPWVYMYMDSSLGYTLSPGETTKIIIKVLQGWYDITEKMIAWQWSRESGSYADDLVWNIAHSSLTKEADISYIDLGSSAINNTSCIFTIQAAYQDAAITSTFEL